MLMVTLSAAAANYDINVAGVEVTTSNYNNVTGGDIVRGTVSYNPSTKTLTLTNVEILRTGSGHAILNRSVQGLTVQFVGTCYLMCTKDCAIRFQCGGSGNESSDCHLIATSGSTVNLYSEQDAAIYVRDYSTLWIEGPGTFNISGQKNGAIMGHGRENATTSDPATIDYVKFSNVTATIMGNEGALYNGYFRFHAGSNVTLEASGNSSYPVARKCQVYLHDGTKILAPWGAIVTGNWDAQITLNGNNVYNQDVYISDDYGLLLNSTNFPDANFRNAMLSLYPKGYLTKDELQNLTILFMANKNISDMTGIEKLTSLRELRCYGNPFSSLNVSALTNLTYLDCAPNSHLTSLNVSGCTNLETLYCYNTGITSLSLGNLSKLKTLRCYNTKLTSLSVLNKSSLTELQCQNCTSMTSLSCYNDNLSSLNVTGNTALKELRCYYNSNLTEIIGMSDCTALTFLDCEDCKISDLSACNSMTDLLKLYARNNKLTNFTLTDKSNLTYVRLNGNTSMTTAEIASNSKLAELYISGCTALTDLKCYNNALTTFNITGNTALEELRCWGNKFTTLNLSGCTALTYLDCSPNSNLSSISNLENTAMKNLICSYTAITRLSGLNDLNDLETLNCSNTNIASLALTNKSKLTNVQAYNNPNLTEVAIHSNSQLTALGIFNCPALTQLYCYDNNLTYLSFNGNTAMTLLNCHSNRLTSLDVSAQTDLTDLFCANNKLSTLDVSNNKKLKNLFCQSNQLISLNVQGCNAMTQLYCNNNKLTSLNVLGCNALNTLYCYGNQISNTGMTTLMNSLPTRSSSDRGTLRVLYNTYESNVFTVTHAAAAAAKYWNPYRYDGSNWVLITASTRGDVNGDGEVNISDAIMLITYIASGSAPGIDLSAADCNEDTEVNISDAITLINYVLNET